MSPRRILSSVEVGAIVAILLCAAAVAVRAAPAGAEVTEFPGFDGELPSRHYAGYITVGHEQGKWHMYYYFATSERNPTTDPVIIWMNGGPACSGFSAFLHSIEGPLIHARDEPRVKKNPFLWTKIKPMEQRHADQTQHASHGGDAPANSQRCAGPNQQHQQPPYGQQPSSLNPTAARLLREAIVSKPAEGGGKAAADGSSDILAFARSVDRVDSTLE